MFIKINMQNSNNNYQNVPSLYFFYTILNNKIFLSKKNKISVNLKIVNKNDMFFLNNKFRYKESITNILSFPTIPYLDNDKFIFIGDIICCKTIIKKESKDLKKNFFNYWKYLIIHSFLHLLNFSHCTYKNIYIMKLLEKKLLFKV